MAKTGRNDPCPCGSGKKYKLCCLSKDDAAARATAEAKQAAAAEHAKNLLRELEEQLADEDLDEASNAVVDLVDAGKLDEAEAAANDLLVRFPEVYDGYDRLGMVAEARGDKKLAAAHYRKVIEFTEQHPGLTDPRLVANFQRMVDELDPPTTT
jgi:tetratricopeptide (TPR) repeat protein